MLRESEFEPIVIRESKDVLNRRASSLKQHGLIEKAKGCDIAIATRMVADAAADLYECCLLFTSDADFMPAIEAVRGMGKVVWVFGYADALPKRSPYLYVPDRFVDLGHLLKVDYSNSKLSIDRAIKSLDESGDAKS